MKIVALLTAKNESWIIDNCLNSLSKISDLIIAIDDNSEDNTASILSSYEVILIPPKKNLYHGWGEYSNRQLLLEKGREMGGTHFIILDADESFTENFIKDARSIIFSLKKGQKLEMQWLALWKNTSHYIDDNRSVFSNNFKDFIFCDNGENYNQDFMHLPRTPITNNNNSIRLDLIYGAVLHYQFSDWKRFQLKQAWYRCSELIEFPNNEISINSKYSITNDSKYKLTKIDENMAPKKLKIEYLKLAKYSWHYQRMLEYFNKFGVVFFEKLEIWHTEDLENIFISITGRRPRKFFHILNLLKTCLKKLM